MSTVSSLAHELDVLLERLLLADFAAVARAEYPETVKADVWDSAIRHVAGLLQAKEELLASDLFQLKLRLAMHFAPASAIAYDPTNPQPRHVLVRRYLLDAHRREGAAVDRLARDIAAVLDRWDTSRRRVTDLADTLRGRQTNRCAHCGYLFDSFATTHRAEDAYKPYHESPDELTAPEVDHIDPVSGFGTNNLDNLQLICRLCNAGKGEGLGIDVKREVLFAAVHIDQIPIADRVRMFYYVIERDGRRCNLTGASWRESELTVRPIRSQGGFVRTNLQAVALSHHAKPS